jgi:hypothetical protein
MLQCRSVQLIIRSICPEYTNSRETRFYTGTSPNIVWITKSRILRWAGRVTRIVEGRRLYMVLVRKPEGKRLLGRPRRRWEDNIKIDF